MVQFGGIVSGLDTASIIAQLKQIALQPVTTLQARKTTLTSKSSAWSDLNTKFLAVKTSAASLKQKFSVRPAVASSSDNALVSAAVTGAPEVGSYVVRVLQMARGQSSFSGGYASITDSITGSGTLTLKAGNGTQDLDVTSSTLLSSLNNGAGVTLGSIKITDRSGASAVIDLTGLETVQDVTDAISAETGVNVTASINTDGTGLLIRDNTGSTNGAFKIEENGSTTAADLKINTGSAGVLDTKVTGTDLDPVYRVVVTAENNSLTGLRDAVNALGGPFSASIANTGNATNPYRLSFTSRYTGDVGALALNWSSTPVANELVGTGDGSLGATAGDYSLASPLSAVSDLTSLTVGGVSYSVRAVGANTGVGNEVEVNTSGDLRFFVDGTASNVTGEIRADYTPAALSFTTAQTAQDAQIEVGTTAPQLFKSKTNLFDQAIAGLSISVTSVDPSKTAQITVDANIMDAGNALAAYLEAYNNLVSAVNAQNKYDVDTSTKGGALFGDTLLASALNEVTNALTADAPGLPSTSASLFQVGVKAGTRGSLALDSSVLTDWMKNRWPEISALMTKTANAALGVTPIASSTASGYNASDVTDGVTTGTFGVGKGWADDTPSAFPDTLRLPFESLRSLTNIKVHTTGDTAHPAATWGLKDFDVQSLRVGGDSSVESDWETVSSIRDNTQAVNSFVVNLVTKQLRLKVLGVNAADGLSRVVEIEATETSGVAARTSDLLSRLTDGSTGVIATAQKSIDTQQARLDAQIKAIQDRVDRDMTRMQNQFSAMEKTLSQLQSMGTALNTILGVSNNSNKSSSVTA